MEVVINTLKREINWAEDYLKEHFNLPQIDKDLKHQQIAKFKEAINVLSKKSINQIQLIDKVSKMYDYSGKSGCTYGDTDYDSKEVGYGYNLGIANVVDLIKDHNVIMDDVRWIKDKQIIHQRITYVIECEADIDKIILEFPDEWEAHNRSDIYKNSDGDQQVDIFYRLNEFKLC